MEIEFTKMNGAGNDFILVDGRDPAFQLQPEQIRYLCHRRLGIGADGLVIWRQARNPEEDESWGFYNSDGSEAEMCGNAARCFASYLKSKQEQVSELGSLRFGTLAGVIRAEFEGDQVTVTLTPPQDLKMDQSIEVDGRRLTVHTVDTGVPHAVIFVPDPDLAMVQDLGRKIRFHEQFSPKGLNVNFVTAPDSDSDSDLLVVRTYERGVEGETLACGTGVTAAALAISMSSTRCSPIRLKVHSGDILEVRFSKTQSGFEDVRWTGPAVEVFQGCLRLGEMI